MDDKIIYISLYYSLKHNIQNSINVIRKKEEETKQTQRNHNKILKTHMIGVPAVVQWVKNPTAVAQVSVEVVVQSPTHCSGLKDQALSQL